MSIEPDHCLHNVFVSRLLGSEDQVVPTPAIEDIGVNAGYERSGVQPGDHAEDGGSPTCQCANGFHIFTHEHYGAWRVAGTLYWCAGEPAI